MLFSIITIQPQYNHSPYNSITLHIPLKLVKGAEPELLASLVTLPEAGDSAALGGRSACDPSLVPPAARFAAGG